MKEIGKVTQIDEGDATIIIQGSSAVHPVMLGMGKTKTK